MDKQQVIDIFKEACKSENSFGVRLMAYRNQYNRDQWELNVKEGLARIGRCYDPDSETGYEIIIFLTVIYCEKKGIPENQGAFSFSITAQEYKELKEMYFDFSAIGKQGYDPEPTIEQLLLSKNEFVAGVDTLYTYKNRKKVINKCLEELSELTTKLLQQKNDTNKVSEDDLLEEVVDAQMHLILIQKYFLPDAIRKMVDTKVNRMVNSKDFKKYKAKQDANA